MRDVVSEGDVASCWQGGAQAHFCGGGSRDDDGERGSWRGSWRGAGAGLAHALGGTLELLLQWACAGASGGVGIGAIASFLLWDLFDDIGEAYEEAKKEVLAERVAPEHDSKGGLSAVD